VGTDGVLKTIVSASNIDQHTGANSPLVLRDYINNPTRSYLPIAFRKVQAFRLSSLRNASGSPALDRCSEELAVCAGAPGRRAARIVGDRAARVQADKQLIERELHCKPAGDITAPPA
jgi:hypothetical protein